MQLLLLIRLDITLSEICAFIIGFSCTVWTKMMLLASSLADGVLADAILIPPCTLISPTNIRMVSCFSVLAESLRQVTQLSRLLG